MSTRIIIALLLAVPMGRSARAQTGPQPSGFGILDNSIANLRPRGDSLWVGPYLNLTTDGGATWLVADTDSLFGTTNRVYSLDLAGDVLWAGLGRSDVSQGDAVQTAAGFLVSMDGGRTFEFRFPQLDAPADTTERYGENTLGALPVIVPQQSPPFDVDWDERTGTLWVAGWASGIRRSTDGGHTFRRVVLPPDELDAIDPSGTYDFRLEPQRGGTGELNHMGFAVLVDEEGTVWAGTPLGVNRSTDGGVSWRRTGVDAAPAGLIGSWVISIEEQPSPGRNPVWMATWNAGAAGGGGEFGVSVTRDGGDTYEHVLHGERIYDFAFDGDRVFAAGDGGLFLSEDGGRTWRSTVHFVDAADRTLFVRPGAEVFSVALAAGRIWAGTADGLIASRDGGATWSIHRVDVPLRPAEPSARVPAVDTYAYPNPFSPAVDRFVRIRYDAASAGTVRVRILDGTLALVRTIERSADPGTTELIWDGTDERGVRLANGVYFYEVAGAGSRAARGKILVLE